MRRRIFNLSLHRSGTKSFVDFCSRNGLRPLHWPGIGFDRLCRPALGKLDTGHVWRLYDYITAGFQAFADLPVPLIYREAMAEAGDATFLIVERSPEDWVRSVRRHTQGRPLDVLEIFQYGLLCGRLVNRLAPLSDAELADAYAAFGRRVAGEAAERGVKFAAFRLDDPAIGAKLARFLGLARTDEFRNVDGRGVSAPIGGETD